MLATEISWQIHWILLKTSEIWHFMAEFPMQAIMLTVGITHPLFTLESINLCLSERTGTLYICISQLLS